MQGAHRPEACRAATELRSHHVRPRLTRMAREGDAPAGDLTTPETWERFLALQGREEQEGFSEDEFPPSRAEGISPR